MQFTGLHDKNGKEIYEGDIVKTSKKPYAGGIMLIEFYEHGFCGKDIQDTLLHFSLESSFFKNCEVIGSAHENPELIK